MTVVRFQASRPVGVNGMYKPVTICVGRRRYTRLGKTDEGQAFCDRLLIAARAAWRVLKLKPFGGDSRKRVPVMVTLRLTFDSLSWDIDGPIKPILDSLQASGIVWNDNRVRRLVVDVLEPDEARPRVEVAVQEMEAPPT